MWSIIDNMRVNNNDFGYCSTPCYNSGVQFNNRWILSISNQPLRETRGVFEFNK